MVRVTWKLVLPMFLTAMAATAAAQAGDPQLRTDHPYYPGEGAMSTPTRVMNFANAVPRGSLGSSTDRDKLIRLFLWRGEHFSHLHTPKIYNHPNFLPLDPEASQDLQVDFDGMRGLFSYGFGLCGTNHGQMRPFAEAYGWTDRRRGLQGDTGYEINVGGWRYVNTDQYTLHFLSNSPTAHFASLDQVVSTNHRYIEWNPDLGMGYRMPQANTHGIYQDFAGVTGTVLNRSQQWRGYYSGVWNILPADSVAMYGEGYTAAPISVRLRRGETFTRWLDPDGVKNDLGLAGRLWWGSKVAGGPVAQYSFVQNAPARDEVAGGIQESEGNQKHANACFDWQPSLLASEHLDGAAAVTGTLVAGGSPALKSTGASTLVLEHYTPYTIAGRPSDGANPVNAASDGAVILANTTGSVPVEVSTNAGATWVSAGTLSGAAGSVDFTDLVKGRNQYLLRLSFDNGEGLATLRVRTITMMNQAVYPNLKDTTTQVTYAAGNTGSIDLSPDLWTSTSANSLTGYVTKESDSGNLSAPFYSAGNTYAYESTNNQPISLVYKITIPPQLAASGATWKDVSAAADCRVRIPPSGSDYGRIEIASAAGGPWTQIANYGPPTDNELSHYWTYGRSVGTLGGTTAYVRFTTYNGGYTSGFRYLRLYGTYSLPAAGAPLTVTYHWNNGSEQSSPHVVAAGSSADSWSITTGSNVAQRKVVLSMGTATLTAASITTHPASQSVTEGQTATFSVVASGTAPLQYQWKKNGTDIPGATASSYTTPATVLADNGALFSVVVTNGSGSAPSNSATLTVSAGGGGGGGATTVAFQQGTAGYTGSTDTYVELAQPASSFGTLDHIDSWTYNSSPVEDKRSLLRFDLSSIPSTATVSSARLILYVTRAAANGAADVLKVDTVSAAWADTVTYNTKPATAPTAVTGPSPAAYTNPTSPPLVYVITGLGSLVQSWVTTPGGNFGMMLYTTDNLNLNFASSEHATVSYRPALELTYTTGGGGGVAAPGIGSQPASTSAVEGTTANFSVSATGTGPFTYQWRRNGVDIGGATSSSYTTPVLTLADDGAQYTVVVSNGGGSVTSSAATLTVTAAGGGGPPPPAPAPTADEGNDEGKDCSCGTAAPPSVTSSVLALLAAGILGWVLAFRRPKCRV